MVSWLAVAAIDGKAGLGDALLFLQGNTGVTQGVAHPRLCRQSSDHHVGPVGRGRGSDVLQFKFRISLQQDQ